MKIKKSEIKEIVKEELTRQIGLKHRIFPIRHIYNPISFNLDEIELGTLNEAYYKTYPFDKVKQHVVQLFGNQIIQMECYRNIISVEVPSNVDTGELDRAMSLCGYYVERDTRSKPHFGDSDIIQYSPRYTDSENEVLENQKWLYHISPLYFKEKILKNGICPLSKNNCYSYPGRVYLIKGYDYDENKKVDITMLSQYASVLLSGMSFIMNKKDERFTWDRNTWVAYKIDVSKLPKYIKLYSDVSWDRDMGVWTYDNISPNAIVSVNNFEID